MAYRRDKHPRHRLKLFVAVVFAVLGGYFLVRFDFINEIKDRSQAPAADSTEDRFDKSLHSISDSSSIWVVVNKGRKLPGSYVPAGLRSPEVPLRFSKTSSEMQLRNEAADALERLFADAKAQKMELMLSSGYRSYGSQAAIYSRNLKSDGQALTDATSARPGFSEHQTGLAADVSPADRECELLKCFGSLPEGRWLAQNAYTYGFIIRYLENKKDYTGYDYEPWHIRYVGPELALQIKGSDQTLEQFFSLPFHESYPLEGRQVKLEG